MKYSIIVQDLTARQARCLIDELEKGDLLDSAALPAFHTNPTPMINDEVETDAPAAVDGELDSSGLPWDERIHAGSRKKNADGTWKRLRGVQSITVETVTEELRARYGSPIPQAPVAAHVYAAPVAPMPVPQAPVAAPLPVPAMPQPVPMPAPAAAPTRDFQGLMKRISELFASKLIAPDYPTSIVKRVNDGFGSNIATLTDVANDLRYVEYAWQCLDVDGKAK